MSDAERQEIDYSEMMGRNIILYGETNTGKSTIIRDLLYHLKDKVPACYVISPTEEENGTYEGIIPDLMIDSRSDLTSEKLKEKLSTIMKREEQIAADYRTANTLSNLQDLIDILEEKDLIDEDIVKEISEVKEEIYCCEEEEEEAREDEILKTDETELEHVIDEFDKEAKKCEDKLKTLYKKVIHKYKTDLISGEAGLLTQNEIVTTQNVRLNPYLIVILDDCGAILDSAMEKDKVLQDIFFNGRHNFVTTIIAVESDNTVLPTIRAEALFSFFCSARILERFGKSNNGLDVKTAKLYAERMRINESEHERILYARGTNSCIPFCPVVRQKFKFGSETIWKFCEFLKQNKQKK